MASRCSEEFPPCCGDALKFLERGCREEERGGRVAAAVGRRGGTLGPGLVRPGRLYAVGEQQVGAHGGSSAAIPFLPPCSVRS